MQTVVCFLKTRRAGRVRSKKVTRANFLLIPTHSTDCVLVPSLLIWKYLIIPPLLGWGNFRCWAPFSCYGVQTRKAGTGLVLWSRSTQVQSVTFKLLVSGARISCRASSASFSLFFIISLFLVHFFSCCPYLRLVRATRGGSLLT